MKKRLITAIYKLLSICGGSLCGTQLMWWHSIMLCEFWHTGLKFNHLPRRAMRKLKIMAPGYNKEHLMQHHSKRKLRSQGHFTAHVSQDGGVPFFWPQCKALLTLNYHEPCSSHSIRHSKTRNYNERVKFTLV